MGCSIRRLRLPPPDEPGLWLKKRRGSAGGTHIATAEASSRASPDSYFQRRVGGKGISALFIAGKEEGRDPLLSACSGARQHPCHRIDMAAAAEPVGVDASDSEEISPVRQRLLPPSLISLASTALIFWFRSDAVWLIRRSTRARGRLWTYSDRTDLFTVCASCRRLPGGSTPSVSTFGVQGGRNRLCPLHYGCARAAKLAALGGGPIGSLERASPAATPFALVLASGATVDLARACAGERSAGNHLSRSGGGALSEVRP